MAPTTQRFVAFAGLGLLIAAAALHESGPFASGPQSASAGEPGPATTAGATSVSWSPLKQEAELGQIRWQRDYDVARAEAKRVSRPLFVLFDEVPG